MQSNAQPLEYLESQPGITFQKLYQEPTTALSVFRRMLPRLAQTIVMGMLFVDEPFPEPNLRAWFRADCRADRVKALSVLEKLHIMKRVKSAEGLPSYQLISTFSASLREALTGSSTGNPFGVFHERGDPNVDIAFLDRYARNRWEAILYYVVGSAEGVQMDQAGSGKITQFTKKLLETGDYVRPNGGASSITKNGFAFLLQEVNAQVWTLLVVYLETCGSNSLDSIELLNFLFKLGSFHLGQAYSTSDMTNSQKKMLAHLSDFGLIYRRTDDSDYFYPTRLATTLASDAPALMAGESSTTVSLHASPDQPTSQHYIVIETNYRLYAYVSSPLQICILALFVRLQMRFPNMVSGKLTKTSITRAFERGITADQIVTFLQRHAHPQMRKSPPTILPPTVVDQIRLWQIEGDQFETTTGFLINQFSSDKEYDDVKKYAQTLGVVTWWSDEKKVFFVNQLDQLRAYLASRQHAQQQRPSLPLQQSSAPKVRG